MWAKGFLPQLPDSTEFLDLLLLIIHKPRKVQRYGIRFQGMRYITPTLAGFVGELVTIRYEMVVKEIKAARSAVKKELYGRIKQSLLLVKKLSHAKKAQGMMPKQENLPSNHKSPSSLKLYQNE